MIVRHPISAFQSFSPYGARWLDQTPRNAVRPDWTSATVRPSKSGTTRRIIRVKRVTLVGSPPQPQQRYNSSSRRLCGTAPPYLKLAGEARQVWVDTRQIY